MLPAACTPRHVRPGLKPVLALLCGCTLALAAQAQQQAGSAPLPSAPPPGTMMGA